MRGNERYKIEHQSDVAAANPSDRRLPQTTTSAPLIDYQSCVLRPSRSNSSDEEVELLMSVQSVINSIELPSDGSHKNTRLARIRKASGWCNEN